MRAVAVTISNPFDPLRSRQAVELRRPSRVRHLAPKTAAPHIALLNGRPLLRAAWRRRLRDGDQLVFCILPRGGRNSNPLRLLLSIALMSFAPWAAGALLGSAASTVLFGSFTLGQATQLGIIMAGQALINAILPPPKPTSMPSASPTYSLSAQGNTARLEQAVPVQYGRLLSYPDFAAQPYTEFAGGEQYLYQLLCLGAGEFSVEEIRIEDTPVTSFAEIETEIVPPGADVTLFPTSVVTSVEVSGQELVGKAAGTWARSGTVFTITEAAHGRTVGQAVHLTFSTGSSDNGVYQITAVPTADTFRVSGASGGGSGAVEIRSVLGGAEGFVANAAGTIARHLAVDLVLPRGLFNLTAHNKLADNSLTVRVEAQRIDNAGVPIGSWIAMGDLTLTDRTVTPIRRSYRFPLATPGRYRVRAWRIDEKVDEDGEGHEVLLAGLRAYLRETEDFGDVTLIAMRMRATNNLSLQASRRVGVIATRKLPVWNGTNWTSPQATRSIAWALADAARNTTYGARMPSSRLDLDALLALDALWTSRGDRFDGRFDQAGSWWEAAARIALAGRSRIFMMGGVLRFVRDGGDGVPVAMFSMRNIKRGSLSIDYLMPSEETADAVEVSYFDETIWAPRRVVAKLPGSTAERPTRMELFGVTQRAQAMREGRYQAAANRYRRRIVRFSTEMEGFIPAIGDLVSIQHDMPAWGASAEAVGWVAGSRTLTLSEPVTFVAGTHYVALRRPDGSVSGPHVVTAGASPDEVILAAPPDFTPYTGSDAERTHVAFGPAEKWSALAKVVGVRPRGLYEVEIEAVPDDPSVHTAETGTIELPVALSTLPRRITKPVVGPLLARRIPNQRYRWLISWEPAPSADVYQIEMADGVTEAEAATATFTRIAETTATTQAVAVTHSSGTLIRVRAVGLAAGPWRILALSGAGREFWGTAPTRFWNSDNQIMWSE